MKKIGDLDKVSTIELGKGYRAPEGLWEWLLGKNDALGESGRCVGDIELIKAFRASNIVRTYRFNSEITRKTMTIFCRTFGTRGSRPGTTWRFFCICASNWLTGAK